MKTLTPELQKQIEQEAEANTLNFKDNNDYQGGIIQGYKDGYEVAGDKYAELWQTAEARADRAEKALKEIAEWKLPATDRFWDHGTGLEPMSYEACYGSNGVRDYFKALATEALTPKASDDE